MGLLYDDAALDAAEQLVDGWSAGEIRALQENAARHGLDARIRGRALQEIAREAVAIARAGLARRARLDGAGNDETHFLDELEEIAVSGITPAELLLADYAERWGHSVEPVYRQHVY